MLGLRGRSKLAGRQGQDRGDDLPQPGRQPEVDLRERHDQARVGLLCRARRGQGQHLYARVQSGQQAPGVEVAQEGQQIRQELDHVKH